MWIDVQQNTDEWRLARCGKLTGSAVSKVMANYPKAFGDPAKRLAVDIALEQITGRPTENGYTNSHMERGHEQEPIARMEYEAQYFCEVTNGGFYDNGFTGCSPDGHIGSQGLSEIKSVIASTQYQRIKTGRFDPAYKWQLPFNLKESDRDWIDYISFCADFPTGKRLFVQRLWAKDLTEEFEMIDKRVAEFRDLVDQVKSDIREAA